MQEAWPEEPPLVVGRADLDLAGSVAEYSLKHVDGFARGQSADERAKDFGPFRARAPCDIHTRKIVTGRNLDVWKGLVIPKTLVVGRLDVLDQAVLCQQRVDFAVAIEEVDVFDEADHVGDLRTTGVEEIGRILKVTGHARAQIAPLPT